MSWVFKIKLYNLPILTAFTAYYPRYHPTWKTVLSMLSTLQGVRLFAANTKSTRRASHWVLAWDVR